jgi:hypothetical protein
MNKIFQNTTPESMIWPQMSISFLKNLLCCSQFGQQIQWQEKVCEPFGITWISA